MGQGPSQGHPLPFPFGEAPWRVVEAVPQAQGLEDLPRPIKGLPPPHPGDAQGQEDVLQGGVPLHQVKVLEEVAHVPPAEGVPRPLPQGGQVLALHPHLPLVGHEEAGKKVEKGGLAASRGPHQGHLLPGGKFQVGKAQHHLLPVAERHAPKAHRGHQRTSSTLSA